MTEPDILIPNGSWVRITRKDLNNHAFKIGDYGTIEKYDIMIDHYLVIVENYRQFIHPQA